MGGGRKKEHAHVSHGGGTQNARTDEMRDGREEERRRRRESSSRTTLKTREHAKEERQTGTRGAEEGDKESTGGEQGIRQAAIKGGRGREEERARGG